MKDFRIGRLAHVTGVKVPTIRFYEQIGLLPTPARTDSGQRRYDADSVRRLAFIRHARDLGFEIEEIRALLELSGDRQHSCSEVNDIATLHLQTVNRHIEQLKSLRDELKRMIRQCHGNRIADCRIIEVLSDHAHCLHEDHRLQKPLRKLRKMSVGRGTPS